eukprot:1408484-Alexandrium_andersonii.AAC.1
MSASLVGSEMCIRDRPPPPPPCCGFVEGSRPRALRGVTSLADQSAVNPVSYTHLTLPTICSV